MEISDVFSGYTEDEKWIFLIILFALLFDVDISTLPEMPDELNPK